MERILIADDHSLVRDGLRTVISAAFDRFELFEAASLDEAIAVIEREGSLDLVLLDLHMPGSNGMSGLERLRASYPAIPVAIVSASQEFGVARDALAAGASGFIPKSLRRSAIVDAIRRIAAGEIFFPEDWSDAGTPAGPAEVDILRRIDTLTPQQKVVLGFVVAGMLNKQIAFELDVSITTVKAHVSAILNKLNVFSRTQAVLLATRVNFHATSTETPEGHH
ncbi:DNA-binding response regulator (plasmid) [Sphingobium sp. SCG-1]|nr:DNA-binding response regulator [Sphingobium sp. SCG-1]